MDAQRRAWISDMLTHSETAALDHLIEVFPLGSFSLEEAALRCGVPPEMLEELVECRVLERCEGTRYAVAAV